MWHSRVYFNAPDLNMTHLFLLVITPAVALKHKQLLRSFTVVKNGDLKVCAAEQMKGVRC